MINPNDARIGYDTTFELDEFKRPRLRTELEVIKNTVMFILFSKPGSLPSLPHIGLNIKSLLYSHYDDIKESDLEDQIISQCNILGSFFSNRTIQIKKARWKGRPAIIMNIATDVSDSMARNFIDSQDYEESKFLVGITLNELNDLIYNISDGRVSDGS